MKNIQLFNVAPDVKPGEIYDVDLGASGIVMGTWDYGVMGTEYEYPTVQYSEDRGLLFSPSPKDVVGSIYYHDNVSNENKFATLAEYKAKFLDETVTTVTKKTAMSPSTEVETLEYSYTAKEGANVTPIGVVVVPASHMSDKKCRVMSLAEMDYSNPENGTNSEHKSICWGQYNVDLQDKMLLHDDFPVVNTNGVLTGKTSSYSGYIASQREDAKWKGKTNWVKNGSDGKTSWTCGADDRIPSPITNFKFNPAYITSEWNGTPFKNPLADFDGKKNTEILCELATAQSDWQTASTITNNSGTGYSPAACCCARYHTAGTNAGGWYLPACGELGYLPSSFQTIMGSLFVVGGLLFDTNDCWSSSCGYSDQCSCNVDPFNGYVDSDDNRSNGFCVRAFLAV